MKKANELMIGDWVFLKNGKVLQTCQVTVIGNATQNRNDIGKYVCLDTSDEFPTCIFEIDKISPIPLTPEILEKNGFVENRGVTSWKFETDRGDLIDIYGFENYHLSINIEDTHGSGKGYRWLLNNLVIFYVHQLQHALRLCEIDKEIKL